MSDALRSLADAARAVTAAAATPAPTQAAATATPAAAESSDDGGNGLAIVALIVGALGLVLGGAGLLAARRANARSGVAA